MKIFIKNQKYLLIIATIMMLNSILPFSAFAAVTSDYYDYAYEAETNNSFSSANSITPNSLSPIRGIISTTSDVDYLKFFVDAGQNITLNLSNIPSGTDYDIQLFSPSQSLLTGSYAAGNSNESINWVASASGTYYAKVYSYTGSSTNYYNLTYYQNYLTATYTGISDYSWCPLGDRAGRHYVVNLSNTLTRPAYPMTKVVNTLNLYTDSDAWPSRAVSLGNNTDLFVFAGHGYRYDASSSLNENGAAHFNASSSTDSSHTALGEYDNGPNLTWNEISFSNRTKWALFYSCNWLTNGGRTDIANKINNMFNGLHLMLGFASKMYLDSREATLLGSQLRSTTDYTIKQAFFNAAQEFQPQINPSGATNGYVYARVTGATISQNDRFNSYSGKPQSYSTNPSGYSSWTVAIPATGIIK